MSQILKKVFILIPTMVVVLTIGIIIFLISSIWIFPEFWGSQSLGKDLYLVVLDGPGCVMVYCPKESLTGKICGDGPVFVPTDNLKEARERIIKEAHDDNWIIAETIFEHSDKKQFYIVSKEFNQDDFKYINNYNNIKLNEQSWNNFNDFTKKNIMIFSDSLKFVRQCKKYGISLKLKDTWIYRD